MPLVALGANSAINTGTVELIFTWSLVDIHTQGTTPRDKEEQLTKPMPTPSTILATMICAMVYEVACKSAPTIMMITPMKIDLRRPSGSPMKLVAMDPRKHPISY
jgi:hypothetical protein